MKGGGVKKLFEISTTKRRILKQKELGQTFTTQKSNFNAQARGRGQRMENMIIQNWNKQVKWKLTFSKRSKGCRRKEEAPLLSIYFGLFEQRI